MLRFWGLDLNIWILGGHNAAHYTKITAEKLEQSTKPLSRRKASLRSQTLRAAVGLSSYLVHSLGYRRGVQGPDGRCKFITHFFSIEGLINLWVPTELKLRCWYSQDPSTVLEPTVARRHSQPHPVPPATLKPPPHVALLGLVAVGSPSPQEALLVFNCLSPQRERCQSKYVYL